MRSFCLVLAIVAFLFSCNNNGSDKKPGGADSAENAGTTAPGGPRAFMNAVNELRTILESKNQTAIAGLFDFPVPDSVFRVYLDDSTFQQAYRNNGDKLSQAMFIKYYDTIARFTYLDEITNIFKHVPVDSLQYTSELEKEFKNKTEPCIKRYSIRVADNLVTLTFGTNSNTEYKSEEEVYCEFTSIWTFRFDGQKLRLMRQDMAG